MSLASGDLTTLAAAKAYLTSAPSDPVLQGLITRVSAGVRNCLNRGLLVPRLYTQQFDGSGTRQLILPEWPLISLASLKICGIAVPIAAQIGDVATTTVPYGYRWQSWNQVPPGEPAVVELIGISYLNGRQNVVVAYTAGYQVTGELAAVPAITPYTVVALTPYGTWATDQGVTYATGTKAALTPVAAAPAVGQYIPPTPGSNSPTYTFAAADVGSGVLLSYGYIPADIEQVTLELIAERSSYRSRVGLRSQSLGGQETIAYDLSGIPRYAQEALAPYVSVLPPAMGAML